MTAISESNSDLAIALLGGSFDPVHCGHLLTATAAKAALSAWQMRLLPCAQSPFKKTSLANAAQRESMLRLALTEYPELCIDTRELRRPAPSYTVDTLSELRAELGSHRPLIFVLGWDAFVGLPRWHQWRELFALAHLAVMNRPGVGGDRHAVLGAELSALLDERLAARTDLSSRPSGHVCFIEVPAVELSSSIIRTKIAAGESVDGMMPKAVQQYIHKQALYVV